MVGTWNFSDLAPGIMHQAGRGRLLGLSNSPYMDRSSRTLHRPVSATFSTLTGDRSPVSIRPHNPWRFGLTWTVVYFNCTRCLTGVRTTTLTYHQSLPKSETFKLMTDRVEQGPIRLSLGLGGPFSSDSIYGCPPLRHLFCDLGFWRFPLCLHSYSSILC